jgi:2-aminoadipate transaminase
MEPSPITFARGAPSLDIIPVDDLRAAAQAAFEIDPKGTFSYGTAGGYGPLRDWIAERHGVEREQVLATNGSMQADAFLFQLKVQKGDTVVVEGPTYDRTLLALRELEADILMIPVEDDGIDVDALALALEQGARPTLAHIIPNFQNPAGCTLSLDKRRRLIELATHYDFTIFEDDPYGELRFEGESLPTMLSLDTENRVVFASSFSKTVCPGIRVGYLVGPKATIAAVEQRATATYISPNMVAQSIVAEFCRSGAPDARFTPPEGGYFLWVNLPEGADVDALSAAARDRGVVFVKGTDFGGGLNTLRLAYSGVTPDEIAEGVGRLAEAYRGLSVAAA